MMKRILFIMLLMIVFVQSSFSQSDDTTKYVKYPGIYGLQYPRLWATKVMRPPTDTIYTKTGVATIGSTLYVGNGTYWTAAGGGSTPTLQQVIEAGYYVHDTSIYMGQNFKIRWDYAGAGNAVGQYNGGTNSMVFYNIAGNHGMELDFSMLAGIGVKKFKFRNSGQTLDTLATLYDIRSAGGGTTSLTSVGGGLDVQTGGAGNVRTLNTGEFDVATNLISLKTGGIANSKLTNSTISGISLGSNLNDLTVGTGLKLNSGTTYNGGTAKTILSDTTTGNAGALATKAYLQYVKDSILALLSPLFATSSGLAYEIVDNFRTNQTAASGFYKGVNGSGSVLTALAAGTTPTGWMFGYDFATGAASYGSSSYWAGSISTGTIGNINISSSYRYNAGTKLQVPALSDATNNYQLWFGFTNSIAGDYYNTNTNGAIFRYTNTDSSGKWIMRTKTGGSATEKATSITVAANTDYELEISIFSGTVYFYINGSLAGTITTNVPTGDTGAVMGAIYSTTSSGTAMHVKVDWAAEGFRKN